MFREQFIDAAGGIYRANRSWSRLSSDQKYREFWSFFDQTSHSGRSVYAGLSVRALLQQGTHSVEHIVPRSLLEFELANAPTSVRRGATVNPLNFAASHRRTNTHRGHAIFDFDGDAIHQRSKLDVRTLCTESTGLDHEGEWVVPPRTRGDIARAVLYMFLSYPLPRLRPENAKALITWHRHDQPSNLEREYNDWVWRRKSIRNPLIVSPEHPHFEELSLYRALTED